MVWSKGDNSGITQHVNTTQSQRGFAISINIVPTCYICQKYMIEMVAAYEFSYFVHKHAKSNVMIIKNLDVAASFGERPRLLILPH